MNEFRENGNQAITLAEAVLAYKNANPDDDNREIAWNLRDSMMHIFIQARGGKDINSAPKDSDKIDEKLFQYLQDHFEVIDEKSVFTGARILTEYIRKNDPYSYLEVFCGLFGISVLGITFLQGKSLWKELAETAAAIRHKPAGGKTKGKQNTIAGDIEQLLRMNTIFAEVANLPKVDQQDPGSIKEYSEDERIKNLLQFIGQSLAEFRGDILSIEVPFLRDLFLFFELEESIGILEEKERSKLHLKLQLESGVEKIEKILYPGQSKTSEEPEERNKRIQRLAKDKRRIQRITRLAEQAIIDKQVRSKKIEEETSAIQGELKKKREKKKKLSIQMFPNNQEIIQLLYVSFGIPEKIPQIKNTQTIYRQSDARKIIIRCLLQIANHISRESRLAGQSEHCIHEVHALNKIRLDINGDSSQIQDTDRVHIIDEWSQAKVRTILTTTIALMVSSVDMNVKYSIKPSSEKRKDLSYPRKKEKAISTNGLSDNRDPLGKYNGKRKKQEEVQTELKELGKKLNSFLQHHQQQMKSIAIDITRIKGTIERKLNDMQPPQSSFCNYSLDTLFVLLKEKEACLAKLAKKSTKKLINDESGYKGTKESISSLQRRFKRLSSK